MSKKGLKVNVDKRVWVKLLKRITRSRARVRVGVLQSGDGGTVHGEITMVELAAIHEFGAPKANIPERSFIRRTFIDNRGELKQMQAQLARAIITGGKGVNQHTTGMTVRGAMEILGTWGAAKVKNTISQTDIPPPLKEATIAAKGSSKPLVDTGQLLQSITYEVVGV